MMLLLPTAVNADREQLEALSVQMHENRKKREGKRRYKDARLQCQACDLTQAAP